MTLTVTSLFSGGGGLDIGFKESGFKIEWAIDIDKAAVASYKENIGKHIILDDITKISLEELPKSDVVIGGPPCQSFSLLGKRNVDDDRGKLVWQYLKILKHINPRYFVFENVTGLKSAKTPEGNKVIDELIKAFNMLGYHVNWEILNAADYGVPQRRKRLIIVGSKNIEFVFPETTHNENGTHGKKKWVSVKEALDDLEEANDNGIAHYIKDPSNDYQIYLRKKNKENYVTDHQIPNLSALDEEIIKHVTVGGNYMDVPDYVPSKRIKNFKKTGGRTTCYGRLDPCKPSYTINTHFNRPNVGCNIHYATKRLITVREALRLQSFPDDYQVISATKRGRHTVVGNAVPPLLSKAIAEKISKDFML
ncbi:DNA cytosine methyltransferase [Kurthia gibsonii]|uniref:DNA cytosine methyltransferase n=1 Tax=Kurthia gibsonii TaxID=33946 RepID=UPI003F25F179